MEPLQIHFSNFRLLKMLEFGLTKINLIKPAKFLSETPNSVESLVTLKQKPRHRRVSYNKIQSNQMIQRLSTKRVE